MPSAIKVAAPAAGTDIEAVAAGIAGRISCPLVPTTVISSATPAPPMAIFVRRDILCSTFPICPLVGIFMVHLFSLFLAYALGLLALGQFFGDESLLLRWLAVG